MTQRNSDGPDPVKPGTTPQSPRILIVADDFTGGNACGALFAEAGLATMTITDTSGDGADAAVNVEAVLDDYDAVVVNANSRHMTPAGAADFTDAVIRGAGQVDLVACRIDTTLRGNVGPTAEAALHTRTNMASESGPRRVLGLCIPAFPTSGRVTVGGQQLLHGRLLEDTELAHDVRSPMTTSVVADILRQDTTLVCRTIELSTVLAGKDAIRAEALNAIMDGVEVIIADAMTNDHIDLVAGAMVDLSREIAEAPGSLGDGQGLEWVSIDPGPGSLALARALLPARETGVILGVSGSATEVTRAQLATLDNDPTITVLRAVLDEDNLPDVEATVAQIGAVTAARAIIVATVLDASDLLELTTEQSDLIPRRLAQITARAVEASAVSGLYTTGGDVTAAVLRELGAVGMEIEREIIPLAVGGHIVGGSAAGLPIVTKGGLIGDCDTGVLCFDHLRQAAPLNSSRPSSAFSSKTQH